MAIKLLESKYTEQNDVIQNVDDGALINFQAAGQRNGRIFGWQLVQAGNTITASAGVLLIQGFRLKNDAVTTIFTLSPSYPLPVSKETRYLYARIIRTGDNATFIFRFTDSPSTAIQNNIERENGIHDYLLAHVTVDASGMVGLTNQIATITASAGGSSGGTGLNIPTPVLNIIYKTKNNSGATVSHLALWNKADYNELMQSYTVRLALYRYIQRGRYRKTAAGNKKIRVFKSGWVKIGQDNIGWRYPGPYAPAEPLFSKSVNLSSLTTETIDTKDGFSYKRAGIICPLFSTLLMPCSMTRVAFMMRQKNRYLPGNTKTPISTSTNPFFIRTTRSKKAFPQKWADEGSNSRYFRNNAFRFAYKAEVFNSAGKKVGETGMSNAVEIRPNLRRKPVEGQGEISSVNLGVLFSIKLL